MQHPNTIILELPSSKQELPQKSLKNSNLKFQRELHPDLFNHIKIKPITKSLKCVKASQQWKCFSYKEPLTVKQEKLINPENLLHHGKVSETWKCFSTVEKFLKLEKVSEVWKNFSSVEQSLRYEKVSQLRSFLTQPSSSNVRKIPLRRKFISETETKRIRFQSFTSLHQQAHLLHFFKIL